MAHSTLLSGSIAHIVLNCPAYVQEKWKAPPAVTSSYAEHGTALHEIATALINGPPRSDWAGHKTSNGYEVTEADVAELLDPAVDAVNDLHLKFRDCKHKNQKIGRQFICSCPQEHTELRCEYPGVPGAYGTLDLLILYKKVAIVADYKFGGGVKVDIADANGNPNAQLMFYAVSVKHLIGDRDLVIAIIQPAFDPVLSYTKVTKKQIADYEQRIQQAVTAALQPNPKHVRGEHCRFAPCKVTCPLWTGPLIDASALGLPRITDTKSPDEWGALLANAKRLVDSAVMYGKQIDAALIEHLEAGHRAPGFMLKPKQNNRKWLDDKNFVAKALGKLGLSDAEIWRHQLQTFQIVDAAAKRRGVEVPDTLRPRPPSTEMTLTYEGDPEAVDVAQEAALFRSRLKALIKP